MTSSVGPLLAGVERLLRGAAVLLMYALMGYIVIGVILRYTGRPLPGVAEISGQILMAPLVFIGIVVAQMRDEHLTVGLLAQDGRARADRFAGLQREFWMVAFALLVAIYGWVQAMDSRAVGERGIDSGAPLWIMRFTVPVLALALILHTVLTLRSRLTRHAMERDGFDEEEAVLHGDH